MADINNNNDKRYDSWEEYYKGKEEERTGLIRHLARADLSFLDNLPREYVGKPTIFKKENVAQYSYKNFILVPVGTNQVRCIHSCFVFGELGKASKVVGILGYRRTSPFKTLNIEHAVKPFSRPRTTRASEEKCDEAWIPTMEEFMECTIVGGFKNLRSEEEDFPATNLWVRAQSFWVHPKIFELLKANNPKGAGKLAIEVMTALDSETLDEAPPEQIHQLMLFLWAVENLNTTKFSLTDASTSELFDNRAQDVMKRLGPERSPSREPSVRHSHSPDRNEGREKRKRTLKKGGGRSPDKRQKKDPKRGSSRRGGRPKKRGDDPSSSDSSGSISGSWESRA
jgi:hypothetical protein